MGKIKLAGWILITTLLIISVLFAYNSINSITSKAVSTPTEQVGENKVTLYIFYGQGCPHCAQLSNFVGELRQHYLLEIKAYEVYFNQENRQLFLDMASAFGVEVLGVPTVFIDEKIIVGFSNSIADSLEQEVARCSQEGCVSPAKILESKLPPSKEATSIIGESSPTENPEKTELKKTLTIPAVLGAAAIDAINPCAFAVLIILMTTVLATGIRRRALLAGLAFTASIYISYFLMGLGLYSAIQATGLIHIFYIAVAILAILIGLFNLKDYLWYGKWFIMEVPIKWRPKLKSLIKGITSIPGAFLVGFVVSLFLLPCTSGPYIVILGLLAKVATRNYAIALLLLYNFIFVLPMLIITGAIYFGFTTTEQAEKWRVRKLRVLHLIAGLAILLIGIGMLIAVSLGIV